MIKVGERAPDFTSTAVFNNEFTEIRLSDYHSQSYVILLFYPMNFTYICPTELKAFSKEFKKFAKLNTEILAISVDSQYCYLAWSQLSTDSGGVGRLNFPLVSDLTKEISTKYELLTKDGVALRGLFIIDKRGIIQHALVNNLEVGRSVEEALRVLQAIQHVQKYPDELCPVNWQPGDEGILPDDESDRPLTFLERFFT